MRKTTGLLLSVVLGLGLAGCDEQNSLGWYQEAGADIDEGGFGNATMQNQRAMTSRGTFLVNLNERFSQEVNPMVNFAFNSTQLGPEARRTLLQQANWIRQFPEIRFRVYGHTDLVGSDAYNKRLGLRRAQTVVAFLTAQGVSRSRLEAVASFGETQPLIVTQGRERRNRRTVTQVSGVVKNSPMALNGKYAEVIFREYVESATELPPGSQSGLAAIQAAGG